LISVNNPVVRVSRYVKSSASKSAGAKPLPETTMDALRFSFRERTLELNRMDIPAISEPNEILIKVAYAGICGTDLHILAVLGVF
jgi:hypothetical protein